MPKLSLRNIIKRLFIGVLFMSVASTAVNAEDCIDTAEILDLGPELPELSACEFADELYLRSRRGEIAALYRLEQLPRVSDGEIYGYWYSQLAFSILEFQMLMVQRGQEFIDSKDIQSMFHFAYFSNLEEDESSLSRQLKYAAILAIDEKFFGQERDAKFWELHASTNVIGIVFTPVLTMCYWRHQIRGQTVDVILNSRPFKLCTEESFYSSPNQY